MQSTGSTAMTMPFEGLHAMPPAPLPYVSGALVRSFLLERPQGNVIVYNSPGIQSSADDIELLGGATRLVMNHAHEGMYGGPGIDVPVFVGDRDRADAAQSVPIAGTFVDRHMIDDDLEVIPTPGHTPGSTSYLWDNGQHRFLFTGDSLWLENGEWAAVVLGSSDRTAILESLAVLRGLTFDVLVPWVSLGDRFLDVVTQSEAHDRLDAVIARVEAGGNR